MCNKSYNMCNEIFSFDQGPRTSGTLECAKKEKSFKKCERLLYNCCKIPVKLVNVLYSMIFAWQI